MAPPSSWVVRVWRDFDDVDDGAAGTVFRDVIMLALIGFVAMVVVLLPHLKKATDAESDHRPPGSIVVEMHWPNEMQVDVDLWVRAPDDSPVGFWNQGSRVFNLLRDDLGLEGDASNRNYEVTYSRGIRPGEYVVNAHMYGAVPPGQSVPVRVVVSVKRPHGSLRQILASEITLYQRHQEETAFRFHLDDGGRLVKGSVNTLRLRLATAG